MKINKLFKYYIIIILVILIIICIYYLYNYVKKLNEGFQQFIIDDLDTFNQNIYNNEPRLINNNQNLKVIKINKNDIITNNIIPDSLVSNNIGIYGFNNIDKKIYYCIDGDSFEYKTFTFNRPTPTNPDYKNISDGCNKNLLSVSSNSLWYYNNSLNDMQNINIDCIYYTKLTNSIQDQTLTCLRLPKLINPITTQAQTNNNEINMPYDRLNLIANNDTILCAIGCEPNIQKIHYCKLSNGIPNINEASIWQTTDLPAIQKSNINKLLINDKFIFLIGKNVNNTNSAQYEIYYRFIEFEEDDTLKNQWIKFDIQLNLINLINPKFIINNDILYIYNVKSDELNGPMYPFPEFVGLTSSLNQK